MKKIFILSIFIISLVLITPVAGQFVPAQLTNNTYHDYYPNIASDASGNTYIIWYAYEGGDDSEIFWAKIDSSGTVTVQQITTNTYGDSFPQIAVDASGNSYITWAAREGGNDEEIFWAKVNPSGVVANVVQITNNTRQDQRTAIVIDSSGNSYIAWHSYTTPPQANQNVSWAKVNSDGTFITRDITTNGYGNFYPNIDIDSSGNSYIAWRGYTGPSTDGEVFLAKVDSSGTFATTQVTINTIEDWWPEIATDTSGNSYLAWYKTSGDNELMWAKADSSGSVTNIVQVTDNDVHDNNPKIVTDGTGTSHLIWEQKVGGDYELFWTKVDTSGGVATAVQITDNDYNDRHVQTTLDPLGNLCITWDLNGEIFWAKVNTSGEVVTLVQVTDNDWTDEYPIITIDSTGTSCLTWHGTEGNNDREVFFTRAVFPRYKPPANPFIFRPIANMHLARANALWNSILEKLPDEVPAGLQAMIDEVQTHMANAATLTNPIYSIGELLKAFNIMEEISKTFNL